MLFYLAGCYKEEGYIGWFYMDECFSYTEGCYMERLFSEQRDTEGYYVEGCFTSASVNDHRPQSWPFIEGYYMEGCFTSSSVNDHRPQSWPFCHFSA